MGMNVSVLPSLLIFNMSLILKTKESLSCCGQCLSYFHIFVIFIAWIMFQRYNFYWPFRNYTAGRRWPSQALIKNLFFSLVFKNAKMILFTTPTHTYVYCFKIQKKAQIIYNEFFSILLVITLFASFFNKKHNIVLSLQYL